jgi:deoxyadenosine/deoxycytidine kinase
MAGKIVAVVGNTAVGKTTLVEQLHRRFPFLVGIEQHEERPFQRLFSQDRQRFALANQVDYLLYRAEQERRIRQAGQVGLQDGGLDMDFRVFTRLFRQRGYLDSDGYRLCERLFRLIRGALPPPELFVWLRAPLDVIAARYAARRRPLSIANVDDLPDLERYLQEWLTAAGESEVLILDASREDKPCSRAIDDLLPRLKALGLGGARVSGC